MNQNCNHNNYVCSHSFTLTLTFQSMGYTGPVVTSRQSLRFICFVLILNAYYMFSKHINWTQHCEVIHRTKTYTILYSMKTVPDSTKNGVVNSSIAKLLFSTLCVIYKSEGR